MKKHLPLLGAGPAYVCVIIPLTAAALILKYTGIIKSGDIPACRLPFGIAGGILILLGILLWALANFQCHISENIQENRLVTTGIYGMVRNPILSGHLLVNTGVLLWALNWFLIILPFLYWLYLTVLLRATEEKWLQALYGREYTDYTKRVNRCIPWFPK